MFRNLNRKAWLKPFLMGAAVAMIINYVFIAFFLPIKTSEADDNSLVLVNVANAKEIYPEFLCTCCGKPLDPDNICCGMMKGMIDYIDKQIDSKSSKDEIMMNTAKQFGLNALAKESTKYKLRALLLAQAPANAPHIIINNVVKDLGVVRQSQGVVTTSFEFRNEGKGDLIIDNLNTSCMCTSAVIVYQGKEGPIFNMNMPGQGKENPKNWQVTIAPGDTAQVKIYYDPMAHGKQTEASLDITRTVSIFSNDPVDFEQKIKIELTQLP